MMGSMDRWMVVSVVVVEKQENVCNNNKNPKKKNVFLS